MLKKLGFKEIRQSGNYVVFFVYTYILLYNLYRNGGVKNEEIKYYDT